MTSRLPPGLVERQHPLLGAMTKIGDGVVVEAYVSVRDTERPLDLLVYEGAPRFSSQEHHSSTPWPVRALARMRLTFGLTASR